MPDFGKYKAGSELATGSFTSIYRATKGSSARPYAIKVLKPTPELWTPKEADRQVSSFLARCEVQKKAARAGRRYWAPVHAFGREGGGAYYVTDQYNLSVESLIDRRVSLSSAGLYRVTLRIVRGLLALEKSCSQAHGNVTPHNVLLVKKGRGNYAVHLSDPAIGVGVGGAAGDLQALGALIQGLITHKPVDSNRDWTLGGLETYHALGSRAGAWREFVGKLLGVGTQLAFTDLAEVLEALKALRPRSAFVKYLMVPGFVLLLGAAVFSVAFPGRVHRWRLKYFGRGTELAVVDDPTTHPASRPANAGSQPASKPTDGVVDNGEAARAEAARLARQKQLDQDAADAKAKQLQIDADHRVAMEREAAAKAEEVRKAQLAQEAAAKAEADRKAQMDRDAAAKAQRDAEMQTDAARQAEAKRKADDAAFTLWVGAITPPPLKTAPLLVAWNACRESWLSGVKRPDENIKAQLDALGEALLAYERDLPDVRLIPELPAALQPVAAQRREAILRKLASAVASATVGVPESLSPAARQAAKVEFERWVKERIDAARAIESADAVLKLDPPSSAREREALAAIDRWTAAAAPDAAERPDLVALRAKLAALPEGRAEKVKQMILRARARDNPREGRAALTILEDVLKVDPENGVARKLKVKIESYYKLPTSTAELQIAAEAGSPAAAKALGDQLLAAPGAKRDPTAAAHWLQVAADADDTDAAFSLANLYATGDGVPVDAQKAAVLFKKAADVNNVAAMRKLAELYSKSDPAQAREWYDKAAGTGDAKAMVEVGRMHARATPPEDEKAFDWFTRAAKLGDPDAMAELAACLAEGRGTSRDTRAAAEWYRQAAEAGNPAASFALGKLAYDRRDKAAKALLETAAKAGSGDAMWYLAKMYKFGEGVLPDEAQAVYWYTEAARHDCADAMFDLGTLYQKGDSVPQDPAQALKWLTAAAERKNVNAAFALGVIYQKGQGGKPNPELAAKYFLAAANGGNSNAMRRMEGFYRTGYGVAADPAEANKWRRKADEAAAQGK